jgi:hypothetical protein
MAATLDKPNAAPLSDRGDASSTEDRRDSLRHPSVGRVRLSDQTRDWPGELVDVGEDGAGVWSGEQVQPFALVSMSLPSSRCAHPTTIGAMVVDSHEAAPGVWRLGLRFERRLAAHELAGAIH